MRAGAQEFLPASPPSRRAWRAGQVLSAATARAGPKNRRR